ncbi:MAG: DUF4147 domain-containing protein [Gammaproteobacteria bacterium]
MNQTLEREQLLRFYQQALDSVQGRTAVKQYLQQHPLEPEMAGALAVLAIGKAADSMFEGALDVLAPGLDRALLITRAGHLGRRHSQEQVEYVIGAHPLPDERSLHAGDRLLAWLAQLPAAMPLLVLLSGGSSALVEKLPAAVSLADLQMLNQWLLSTGLPIERMNRIRCSVSLLKGGRLLGFIGQRAVTQLLISDVPGDDPAVIGSGLCVPPQDDPPGDEALPDWLRAMQTRAALPAMPAQVQLPHTEIVANNQQACERIRQSAVEEGYDSHIVSTTFTGDVNNSADEIMRYLQQAGSGCYIWGGETTVQLPAHPGRGGRNQQLALLLAQRIQTYPALTLLCAGTDGSDGPTEDAGALVDAGTIWRGRYAGMDEVVALNGADAGSFLAASGDLINTGPTGTNVMDLVIALKT